MARNVHERIDITSDELKKFEGAMKNDQFRTMFVEYAKELADPENKKRYEEEIMQMAAERGRNVALVVPQPRFVVKSSYVDGGKKVFLNMCESDKVGKASCWNGGVNEPRGLHWRVPLSVISPREDLDKSGKQVDVYDAIFHPESCAHGLKDIQFQKLMVDSAMDVIDSRYKVCLDRKRVRFCKMKYKGSPSTVVMRLDKTDDDVETCQPGDGNSPDTDNMNRTERLDATGKGPVIEEPHYTIVHRGYIDLQNYTTARDATPDTRPRELVVTIDLPRCESSACISLDVLEKYLNLESRKQQYSLNLALPFPVDNSKGKAKFDKSKRRLTVTLPVLPAKTTENAGTIIFEGSCPHYTFHQDNETVTFILHVCHVITESLTKDISPHKIEVKFRSRPEQSKCNENMCYSFCVLFPSENHVVAKESRVEILCATVVIVLWKDMQCQRTWQTFKAGPSQGKLVERMFLTAENVDNAVRQMENSVNDPWRLDVAQPVTCNVCEMTDKHVTVQMDQSTNSTTMENSTDIQEAQSNMSPTLLNDRPADAMLESEAEKASTPQLDKNFSHCWPCLEDEHGLQTRIDEKRMESKEAQGRSSREMVSIVNDIETRLDCHGQQRSGLNEQSKDVVGLQQDEKFMCQDDEMVATEKHPQVELSSSLMFDLD